MNTPTQNARSLFHRGALLAIAASVALGFYALPHAQAPAKKALTIDDYTKWRSIAGQEMSPDGRWVAYTLQLTNTAPGESKPVLHLLNLETTQEVTVPDATEPAFSSDSAWLAYQVDPWAAQRARAGRSGSGGPGATEPAGGPATPPQPGAAASQSNPAARTGVTPVVPPRRFELRNLATGAVRSWQDIGTYAFSATSTHMFLRRRGGEAPAASGGRGGGAPGGQPPGGGGGRGGATDAPAGPRGVDVVLLDLRTGRHQLLGSVADIAFNRTGELLAYTVDAAVKDVNGLFVFDTASGRTTVFDNDAKSYNRLAWNDEGHAIAVLRGSDVEKMREKDNALLAFPDVTAALKDGAAAPAPVVLEPGKADNFPKGWVISDRAPLAWSEDNTRVFFGMKEQVAPPDTDSQVDRRDGGRGRVEHGRRARAVAADDPRGARPQLHFPPGVRRGGEAVRQARRRDDEGPGRGA